MSQHTKLRITFAVLCLAGVGPAQAFAQGSTSFGIYGGMYSPLGREPSFGSIGGSVDRSNSFAFGARLNYWGPGVFGLEAVGGFTPAKVQIAGAPLNGERNQDVLTAALKLMLGISPAVSPVGFHVGVGPAFIRRGHDALHESQSSSHFGAVANAGIRVPMTSRVHIRVDAEDYIYGGHIAETSKTWNDLVLSAGLGFELGGSH